MQILFVLLLICTLAAAVVSFAVMAIGQHRRTGALTRESYRLNMRFSAADPFDIPRCFGGFAVIGGGHSPSASNVTYGRIDGCPVRAFDFRCEAGHGTRRETRHYGIIALEAQSPLPEVLMWPGQDARRAPPTVRWRRERIGPWLFCGDESFARVLADGCRDFADRGLGIQTRGPVLLLSLPVRGPKAKYTDDLCRIGPLLRKLRDASAGFPPAAPDG